MSQPIYLVCGVSGSGKSWVCKQLADKFAYVPHDQFFATHSKVVMETADRASKPVITEVPFGERLLAECLTQLRYKCIIYFVVEKPEVVKARYEKRENKPIPQSALTRAGTLINRAIEWNAPYGTSQEILTKLRELTL